MKPSYIIISFLFIISCLSLRISYSQSLSDTIRLKEVEIKSNFTLNNEGFKRVKFDTSLLMFHLNADLSTILSQNTTIFIKSYGEGNLSTASFRGTTANHTQVEWNGINLNSPMLGQMDLSQIPAAQFSNIEILYGAASIPKTTGAFGGVINLVSNPDWNNQFDVRVVPSIASFGTYAANAKVSAGNQKFQSITKLVYLSSENSFPFLDDSNQVKHQRNGYFNNWGITQELFFRIRQKNFLSVRAWYSNSYNDIPPVITNVNPVYIENIAQSAFRGLVEGSRYGNNYSATIRSAYINQSMTYRNDTTSSNHYYSSWVNRARFTYSGIHWISIKPGIDANYDWVVSDQYEGKKRRGTIGLFTELNSGFSRKIELSLSLREDLIDGKFVPPVIAFGINYKPFKKPTISFTANISKNYRYPSLNDLYWSVSGNPDLKPETDYSAETGIVYHFSDKTGKFFLETELTGYDSWMNDLITWSPDPNNSYIWKPENIDEVQARGIEVGINLSYAVKDLSIKWTNNYHFCKSTYEKTHSTADASLGKQLIYIPENTFNSMLKIEKSGFFLIPNYLFTGKRYTGKDNLSYMPAYNLLNIIFGKNLFIQKFVLSLQLQINNLFDLDYQSIASYPMPGRNYALTIRLNYRK